MHLHGDFIWLHAMLMMLILIYGIQWWFVMMCKMVMNHYWRLCFSFFSWRGQHWFGKNWYFWINNLNLRHFCSDISTHIIGSGMFPRRDLFWIVFFQKKAEPRMSQGVSYPHNFHNASRKPICICTRISYCWFHAGTSIAKISRKQWLSE